MESTDVWIPPVRDKIPIKIGGAGKKAGQPHVISGENQ